MEFRSKPLLVNPFPVSSSHGFSENILVGVLAEDVPDDHNSLLDHVVDLGLD